MNSLSFALDFFLINFFFMMSTDWGSHQMSTFFFLFRYDLGTMSLNQVGELRKYHQFIGIFSTEKGTFDHKSTNQPKPPATSNEKLELI